jgi:hypothetical protein
MNWFKKLFKKKESLRDKCVAAYGEEFGEMYDAINRGEAIGGFLETAAFIDMLEAVKKGKPIDLNNTDENKKSEIKVTGAFIPGQNGEPDVNITIDENGNAIKTFI